MADRPPTKGLSVTGSTPPTRSGAATSSGRIATSQRISATALASSTNPKDALTGQLIKRMRLKFGEAAADIKGQEIVAQEVLEFMNSKAAGGKLKEADLAALQGKIRQRLVGGSPMKNTLAAETRARVEGDEWAHIFEFHIAEGQAKERSEAEAAKRRQEELRLALEQQLADAEERKKRQQDVEMEYFRQEQEALRKAEADAEARRVLQREIMLKLKDERLAQVAERGSARVAAEARKRAEEEYLAARMAYETRSEFEKEEEARQHAKLALKEFLLQNEANKTIKEEAKKKVWEDDARFQKLWEAQLDKQERERIERLEKFKAVQARQCEDAKSRPEAKRWLDQAIIDKQYKEREDARAAEEERRVAKAREGARKVTQDLGEQLRERERRREEQRKQEEELARMVAAKVAAGEEAEKARRAALAQQKLKIKEEIEAQMRENAARRRVAPMSETEKIINAKLLGQVNTWRSTGTIPGLQAH